MRNKKLTYVLPLFLIMVVACSITPKQQAIVYMDTYNSLENQYNIQKGREGLIPQQIEILRDKKKVLDELLFAIQAYNEWIATGKIPVESMDKRIDELLDAYEQILIKQYQEEN